MGDSTKYGSLVYYFPYLPSNPRPSKTSVFRRKYLVLTLLHVPISFILHTKTYERNRSVFSFFQEKRKWEDVIQEVSRSLVPNPIAMR